MQKKVTFHTVVKPTNGQVTTNSICASKPETAPHNYFQEPQDQAICICLIITLIKLSSVSLILQA